MNSHDSQQAIESLQKVLGPEVTDVISAIREGNKESPFYVELPDPDTVDLTTDDLASLVVKTSNNFGRASRRAGRFRALLKITDAAFKHKLKTSMVGKSDKEREANAYNAAKDEMMALSVVEAVVELAESHEAAARVASESARKLYDKVQNVKTAQSREERGYLQEKDFSNSSW